MVNDGVVDIGGLKVLVVPGRGFPQNVPCDAYLLESAGGPRGRTYSNRIAVAGFPRGKAVGG